MSRKKKKRGNDKALTKLVIITAILNLLNTIITLLVKLLEILDR